MHLGYLHPGIHLMSSQQRFQCRNLLGDVLYDRFLVFLRCTYFKLRKKDQRGVQVASYPAYDTNYFSVYQFHKKKVNKAIVYKRSKPMLKEQEPDSNLWAIFSNVCIKRNNYIC